jgi:hypothetical protein
LHKEVRLWGVSIVTFPMNLDAAIGSVKALSDDDKVEPLTAINEDRKAIDRHQRSIRMHLRSLFDVPDDDDSGDDPSLLVEGDEDDDDGDKAFLVELRKLAREAEKLASK